MYIYIHMMQNNAMPHLYPHSERPHFYRPRILSESERERMRRGRLRASTTRRGSNSGPEASQEGPEASQDLNDFFCAISGRLMADPVISFPSNQHVDRVYFNAIMDVEDIPSVLSSDFASHEFDWSRNHFLKRVILEWCRRNHIPPPRPVTPAEARFFVKDKLGSAPSRSSGEHGPQPSFSNPTAPPTMAKILQDLKEPTMSVRREALQILIADATGHKDRAISLCTPSILDALFTMMNSVHKLTQTLAVKAILTLSQEEGNRLMIVGCGALPPLLRVLVKSIWKASADATRAISYLAQEDANRLVIGAVGAIPKLLEKLNDMSYMERQEAASAIYFLTLAPRNAVLLANTGPVPNLMGIAQEKTFNEPIELRKSAVALMCNLSCTREGSNALLDGGAVDFLVGLIKNREWLVECCLRTFVNLSTNNRMEFRRLAGAAGAVALLQAGMGRWTDDVAELATTVLNSLKED